MTTENMRSFAENLLFVNIKGRSKVNSKYDWLTLERQVFSKLILLKVTLL